MRDLRAATQVLERLGAMFDEEAPLGTPRAARRPRKKALKPRISGLRRRIALL
jgi:hypothetical protein